MSIRCILPSLYLTWNFVGHTSQANLIRRSFYFPLATLFGMLSCFYLFSLVNKLLNATNILWLRLPIYLFCYRYFSRTINFYPFEDLTFIKVGFELGFEMLKTARMLGRVYFDRIRRLSVILNPKIVNINNVNKMIVAINLIRQVLWLTLPVFLDPLPIVSFNLLNEIHRCTITNNWLYIIASMKFKKR